MYNSQRTVAHRIIRFVLHIHIYFVHCTYIHIHNMDNVIIDIHDISMCKVQTP